MNEPILGELSYGSPPAQAPKSSHELLAGSTAGALADHHTDLLALAWRRRPLQLANPLLNFADLAGADERLLASLHALCALGAPARAHLQTMLKDPLRAGEMFVMTLYSLTTSDAALLDTCTALQRVLPELKDAWVDGFRWAPPTPLLESRIAELPLAARLQVVSARYRDFDGIAPAAFDVMRTVDNPSPDEIWAALELLSRLGRTDLAAAARLYLGHGADVVQLAAARTLLGLGDAAEAPPALDTLSTLAESADSGIAEAAVQCLAMHAPEHLAPVLHAIKGPTAERLRILALGWTGSVDAVPVLADYLGRPDLARVAGASLSLITGSDPSRDGWMAPRQRREEQENHDAGIPALDRDIALPWPDANAFAVWWADNKARFDRAGRYFLGGPIATAQLLNVIKTGPLASRSLAAGHWQRLTHGPLFPTELPAPTQRAIFPEMDRSPTP